MIEVFKIEGKTEEELLKEIDVNETHYVIEEQPGKLFKSKKYELTYVNKKDIKDAIKEFIKTIEISFKAKINVEIRVSDNIYNVGLISEDNARLIGKEGKTLNSIQMLIQQMINNKTGLNIRVNLDASNYKSKKQDRLEYEMKRLAKEVLRSKVEVKLDPMNSFERRIVHSIIGEFKNLETESIGETPNRYIVIRYKED